MDKLLQLWESTGIYQMELGQVIMILVCLGMIYLAIRKGFEPLLLIPIGFGGILLANPRTLLLGAAAQFGIFGTLMGALALTAWGIPGFEFTLKEAASIAIIGGADGPTSIFVTSQLAPQLLGPIAVAAYAYMALVPMIQPPIMRALTTEKDHDPAPGREQDRENHFPDTASAVGGVAVAVCCAVGGDAVLR